MYHDLAQAKQVISNARARVRDGYQAPGYIPQRAYWCSQCHRWHLTSEPDPKPYSDATRRLVLRCLSMNGSASAKPTSFVAGWNQPGYLPDNEPEAFDSIVDAAAYLRDELERAHEAELDDEGDVQFFSTERVRDAIRRLDAVTDLDTEWSSGEALAGWVYWIAPEVVTPAQ
jgi:hypothetical protein